MTVLKIHAPAVRYAMLRLVLAACLLLPLVRPHAGAAGAAHAATSSVSAAAAVADAAPGDAAALLAGLSSHLWAPAVTFLLIAGICIRLAWIGAGVLRLRRLRSAGTAAPPGLDHQDLQSVIGTRAAIRYVADLGQPVTFGWRRPVVLLPGALTDQTEPIRRAVVAHELWHVRRRDWSWTLAEEMLRAVCWFHPAVWILLSKIQFAREELVDELTILATGSRRHYLDALLAFADYPPLAAAAAFARRRHLVHRMLLISKEAVMSARRIVVSSALLVVVTGASGWYGVRAFPLVQTALSADVRSVTGAPGPLELAAKPVTPENPVPRRLTSADAELPGELESIGAHALITFRITLDNTGRIAETRLRRVQLYARQTDQRRPASVSLSDVTAENLQGAMNATLKLAAGQPPQPVGPLLESAIESAIRALRQWQYAAPAAGPLAFPVSVPVGAPPPPPPPPPPAQRLSMPPPPPPPPPPPAGSSATLQDGGALRVGGNIKPPAKIRNVNPLYPEEAKAAGIQGVVILEVRVEGDGTVGDARILRSVPGLDEAALDAVRQWLFTPTLLNGNPVPVLMTVTVNFTLQ
jgi:TonB family protein